MAIVCGTDFSPVAHAAARTAAQLAARTGDELLLVHVLASFSDDLVGGQAAFLLDPVRRRLEEEAKKLRALGATVRTESAIGIADEVLVERAASEEAWLLVVGSTGKRGARRLLLGSTSERSVLDTRTPILVIRDEDADLSFDESRPLRVMLGADFSAATEAAVSWLAWLCERVPCEVIATQIVWPPELHGRLGLDEYPMDPEGLPDEAAETLERALRKRLAPLEGKAPIRIALRPGFGQPAAHLARRAEREDVDLVVMGTHQRRGIDRLRHGSMAMNLLRRTELPLVFVPPMPGPDLGAVPTIRRVLAPTDLSPHGDRATRMAYAQLPIGGKVLLFHVVEGDAYTHPGIGKVPAGDSAGLQQEIARLLRALVPPEAEERGIVTEVEVVESNDAATAIAQAAERFGADVICMGSHGRSGLGKAVMGSVTSTLLGRTARPVLVVRPQGSV